MNRLLLMFLVLLSTQLYGQTKIVAHRGFSSAAPENTLAAFEKAITSKADYFELDVHKSKDDSLVVIHNSTVDETTSNGATGVVAQMTYDQLTAVKVGYSKKFSAKRRALQQ